MSDYTNTFGGAAKDSANDTILGAAHDTEYDNIATMSATKANKVTSPTANQVLLVNGSGDLAEASGLSYASAVLSMTAANGEIRLGNRALADGDGTLRVSSYGDGITSNDWIGVNVQGSSGSWTQGRAGDGACVIGFDTRAGDATMTLRSADDDASVGATPGWNVQLDLNANALNPTFDVDIAGTQRFQVTSSGAEVDGNFFIDAGDLVIEETADHSSTPTAGRGYLWVKNDTPNTLQFTDDAGNDMQLGTKGEQQTVLAFKAADEDVAASTTLQNDDDITFELEANATYLVEFFWNFTGSTGGDIKFNFSKPTSCTWRMLCQYHYGLSSETPFDWIETTTDIFLPLDNLGDTMVEGKGYITNGANAGTFVLQWAQQAATGTSTHTKGSWMKLTKVA